MMNLFAVVPTYGTRVEDANERRIAPGNLRTPPKALPSQHRCPWRRPGRTVSVIRHGIDWLRRLLLRGRLWSRVWLLPEPSVEKVGRNPNPTWRSPAMPLPENPIHTPVSPRRERELLNDPVPKGRRN